eukprot:1281694-Pleurochrysis_carterae.AAC.2
MLGTRTEPPVFNACAGSHTPKEATSRRVCVCTSLCACACVCLRVRVRVRVGSRVSDGGHDQRRPAQQHGHYGSGAAVGSVPHACDDTSSACR